MHTYVAVLDTVFLLKISVRIVRPASCVSSYSVHKNRGLQLLRVGWRRQSER